MKPLTRPTRLPEIVANGRKEAERILESLESRHRVSLQTREMVFPAKDVAQADLLRQSVGRVSESVTRQSTSAAVGLRDEAANPTYTSIIRRWRSLTVQPKRRLLSLSCRKPC